MWRPQAHSYEFLGENVQVWPFLSCLVGKNGKQDTGDLFLRLVSFQIQIPVQLLNMLNLLAKCAGHGGII